LADRALTLAHFFPSFSLGGQQRRLATLVEGLGPRFTHRIYSLDGDLGAASLLDGAVGVRVEPLSIRKTSFLSPSNIARLRKAITQAGADLLCTYNFGSVEAVLANRFGPNIAHVHHEDGFGADEASGEIGRRVLARRIVLAGAKVTVPSMTLQRIAVDRWRLFEKNVTRITPGIDLPRFQNIARIQRDEIIIGAVGALRAEKNFARLIRCFETAAADCAARLVIFGDGPERDILERSVAASPMRERIRFAGATQKPELALAEFDIFALTSDTEQTPISLMEAMAAGLPAIATDVGDVRALLGSAAQGNVFAIDDEAGLARRLSELARDERKRREIGALNAETATGFARKPMIDAFKTLYLETAGIR